MNLKDEEVITYFLGRRKVHFNVVGLNEDTVPDFVDKSIARIKKFLKKNAINNWKKDYNNLILPEIHILLGTFLQVGKEISPDFEKYVSNENIICQKVYEYLTNTQEGLLIKEELNRVLGDCIDLENNKHSEIEVICWYSYS